MQTCKLGISYISYQFDDNIVLRQSCTADDLHLEG